MRKSFTLMEIVVAAVIVVVLATLGMGGYIFLLEKAEMQKCAVNQETLYRVAEIKTRETGTLGKFDLEKDKEYIIRAYAEKVKEAGWFTKFSYFLVKIHTPKQAYAVPTETLMDENIMRKYGVDPQILYCPSTGNKYGINGALDEEEMSWDEIPAGTILIGDCANNTFTNLSELHPSHYVNPITDEGKAVMITVEGKTMAVTKEPHGSIKKTEVIVGGESMELGDTIYKDGGGGRAQLSDTGVLCIKCEKHTNLQARKNCIAKDCPLSVGRSKQK